MTDPTQFIVDQAHLHNVLTHQGVLGKGRDYLTNKDCSLHLYSDRFKRTYVMQQYDGVDQHFVSDKMTRITKTAHTNFMPNTTRLCCVCTRKNAKNLFELSLFYDATGVYGYSLEYIIKMKIKNSEKFDQSEIWGFFWQMADFIMLSGRHTGEYLEITPVNVFCKTDDYYGYNFFPNNFGLNFDGTKWERKYHNPQDQFWKGQKNVQGGVRTTMFTLGMILLEMACLLPTSELYLPEGPIDQKALKKRIEGVKLTISPQLAGVLTSLLNIDQQKRVKISDIYKNQELMKLRKIDFLENKAGVFDFKMFEGIMQYDQKTGIGEGLDQHMCFHRGKFKNSQLHGLGLLETQENTKINAGIFFNGKFQEGTQVSKNQSILIGSKTLDDPNKIKGAMIILNIWTLKKDKAEKVFMVAAEGQFINGKLAKGTKYYSDGREQKV